MDQKPPSGPGTRSNPQGNQASGGSNVKGAGKAAHNTNTKGSGAQSVSRSRSGKGRHVWVPGLRMENRTWVRALNWRAPPRCLGSSAAPSRPGEPVLGRIGRHAAVDCMVVATIPLRDGALQIEPSLGVIRTGIRLLLGPRLLRPPVSGCGHIPTGWYELTSARSARTARTAEPGPTSSAL
jgi:hypothetical protein